MSIIGPRPEITSITLNYSQDHQKVFQFKPGITGYSQVNGRQMLSPEERVNMEIDYYKRESLIKDISLILLTLKVIITNHGNR